MTCVKNKIYALVNTSASDACDSACLVKVLFTKISYFVYKPAPGQCFLLARELLRLFGSIVALLKMYNYKNDL